jgi:hypothetical protein
LAKWFAEFLDRYGALTVFDLLVDYIKSNRISLIRQIRCTPAEIVGVPCHSCHGQVKSVRAEGAGVTDIHVKYL